MDISDNSDNAPLIGLYMHTYTIWGTKCQTFAYLSTFVTFVTIVTKK